MLTLFTGLSNYSLIWLHEILIQSTPTRPYSFILYKLFFLSSTSLPSTVLRHKYFGLHIWAYTYLTTFQNIFELCHYVRI
jgi:hypothetical protein